tara:strand:+ start:4340 stop:7315 length:2976 start_codon:yes stop_codon:yes gene_type:complete
MKFTTTLLACLTGTFSLFAQFPEKSIHQEQLEYYNSKEFDAAYYQSHNIPSSDVVHEKNNCALDKIVFGWHPYWSNGYEVNYNWDLLSDLSYFSYEVDAATGNANSTHGFATAQAVTDALSNGVRVNLCVTLFSDHATFLGNPTARQTLITNLITLVQNRGAHGVNIDFESMPSSVSADYTSFMIDLCNQMHSQIPGSQVSIAMHAVDWSGFYDIPALEPYVDLFCVMGYDYYWTGSANAGPNDPLYQFQNTYNYTLSRSTTYYLDQGVPRSKLVMGLPYYGREWNVTSHTLPATTTANGVAALYRVVKNNVSGDYDLSNRNVDQESRSVYYNFFDGGTPVQCFISEEEQLGERMEFVQQRGLAGIGIWALGYDDGFLELWNEIKSNLTNCYEQACSGTFYDIGGGPFKNYYDDENYTFTIAPPNAVSLDISFSSFDVEQGFDYLYVYDGVDDNAPQIAGSPFSGTTIPADFTTSSGAVTFKFISDGNTTAGGFEGTYSCNTDEIDPITSIDPVTSSNWQTEDFSQDFNDEDNINGSGIHKAYYNVAYLNDGEWTSNQERGFYFDDFDDETFAASWNVETGTWSETASGVLMQDDESLGNTNIWSSLDQSLSNHYVYHWKGRLSGSGANRRAGLHIFCDDPTAVNRGNSYFVWFRLDDDKVQFYKSENDVFGSPVVNNQFDFQENIWYDFKLIYDRIGGEVWIYINNDLVGQWTDNTPISTGDYISFRSGNAIWDIDSLRVYRSRYPSLTINVGPTTNDDIRAQNPDASTPSGLISSIVKDSANNLSLIDESNIDVDWTAPEISFLNDGELQGQDVDTIANNMVLEAHAHWSAIDTHSNVSNYQFAIGTQPFLDDIVGWTSNALDTSVVNVASGNFVLNEWYFFSMISTNNAGLSDTIASDGFRLIDVASLETEILDIPKVFPNPVNDKVTVQSNSVIAKLSLYDLQGKLILNKDVGDESTTLDLSELSSGSYNLRVFEKNRVVEIRLIKQ